MFECDYILDVRAEGDRLVLEFNRVTISIGEDCARALAYILQDLGEIQGR